MKKIFPILLIILIAESVQAQSLNVSLKKYREWCLSKLKAETDLSDSELNQGTIYFFDGAYACSFPGCRTGQHFTFMSRLMYAVPYIKNYANKNQDLLISCSISLEAEAEVTLVHLDREDSYISLLDNSFLVQFPLNYSSARIKTILNEIRNVAPSIKMESRYAKNLYQYSSLSFLELKSAYYILENKPDLVNETNPMGYIEPLDVDPAIKIGEGIQDQVIDLNKLRTITKSTPQRPGPAARLPQPFNSIF